MLKALEVLLCLRGMTRPLQRTCETELRRCVQRANLQGFFEVCNRLVELPHLLVAGAFEIPRVCISGIELHRLLKAGQRIRELITPMLCQSEVVPRLRILWINRNSLLEPFFGLVQLLFR